MRAGAQMLANGVGERADVEAGRADEPEPQARAAPLDNVE